MSKKKIKEKIGGMALFNGLLLRNKKREVISERYATNEINVKINKLVTNRDDEDKITIYDIPIIRGMISLKNTIMASAPYVLNSANFVLNKKDNIKEEYEIDKFDLICAYIISLGVILCLFTAIPNLISSFMPNNIRNIVQAVIQSSSLIVYLLMLSQISGLKKLFEYHGAEHKVVNAYEHLKEKDITIENVKKQSRFHPRCGGNFIIYFFILILFITFIIPSNNLIFKTILEIILVPFFIGLAYEIVMFTECLPGFLKFISYPAMGIQFITTKEPSDDKIELAIYTLFGCIKQNTDLTVRKYIDKYITNKLKGIDYDSKDILRLVAHVKNSSSSLIFSDMDNIILTYNEQIKLDSLLNKYYFENIPLQYILGSQVFYNEEYIVNEYVLIPRSDSEILVQKAIEYIDKYNLKEMIDMCTGSGCLGISIANNSNINKVVLADISKNAIEVANKNIDKNNCKSKCHTIVSDLFFNFDKNIKYDLLVSNPPYIKTSDITNLSEYVKNEPKLALDGGEDGMRVYARLLNEAKEILKDNSYVIFEIGYDELYAFKTLLKNYNEYELIENQKDLCGNNRVVVCRFQKK